MRGARSSQRRRARRPSYGRLAAVLGAGFFLSLACSSSLEGPPPDPGSAAGHGGSAGSAGRNRIEPDGSTPIAGEGGQGWNALCSVSACNPDDAQSCAAFQPLSGSAEQLTTLGGAGGQLGAAGASSVDAAGAGSGGAAGAAGSGPLVPPSTGAGQGGTWSGEEGGSGGVGVQPPVFACRVVREGRAVATECRASGRNAAAGPCFDSADCAAGLACVRENDLGRCRPFCCGGDSSCRSGSYCAEREILEEGRVSTPLVVPVCVPADACDLGEPPCERDGDCECAPGTACQVVRPDGTTACLVPGVGSSGQACPCAYGHVCSRAANSCLALCRTGDSQAQDDDGSCRRCQASSELPEGWGVCLDG